MQIIQDRMALHQIPELDKSLPRTLAYLQNSLKPLSCRIFSPAEGSLCVFFDFGRSSAIAFRADADALPIQEKTGLPFASRHEGRMHACGHDGHMAILLELARRLDKKESLPHNVLLVFQAAEETTGGAKDICDSGVFKEYAVEAIFGLHVWPGLPKGTIASREQELMSRSCEVHVDIYGRSAHIAKAREGIDALAAGAEFYTRVRELEAALPDDIFRLLNFGLFQSGTAGNAISAHTYMKGSLRAFQDEVFEHLRDGVRRIGAEVAAKTGCTFDIRMGEGYPAVMNPPALYQRVRALVEFAQLPEPSMTTEDFSWYQRSLPGVFFLLGVGDTPPLHAENFDFDMDVLKTGADFFENLAEKF